MILYSVNEHRLCLMPKNLFIESKHRSLYFLFFTIRPTFQNSKITTNYFFCYSVIDHFTRCKPHWSRSTSCFSL